MKWNYDDLIIWINNGCDQNIAKNIIELDCSHNKLQNLPPEIGRLINLQIFDFSNNEIECIPPNFQRLIYDLDLN